MPFKPPYEHIPKGLPNPLKDMLKILPPGKLVEAIKKREKEEAKASEPPPGLDPAAAMKTITDIIRPYACKAEDIKEWAETLTLLVKHYEETREDLPPGVTPLTAAIEAIKEVIEAAARN